jgi:hypothetical protein
MIFRNKYILLQVLFLISGLKTVLAQNYDVMHWQGLYDTALDSFRDYTLQLSKSPYSSNHYYVAYGLDGAIAMYEASGDTKYIDFAFELVENVIASAVPTCDFENNNKAFPCGYLGWPVGPALNTQYSLNESFFFRYVTRLLRVIKQDKVLHNNLVYFEKYSNIHAFVEKHIWEKWYSRGPGFIYRGKTHMATHWAFIAMNLDLISSYLKPEYSLVVDNINFKGFPEGAEIRSEGASLNNQKPFPLLYIAYFSWINDSWDNIPASHPATVQDVGHASSVVAYLMESYEQCRYWKYGDISGLKEMFLEIVWKDAPGSTAPQDCMDFSKGCQGMPEGVGRFHADGWVKLGRYFPEVQKIYEDPYKLDRVISYIPRLSFNLYAHLAYNAKILSEIGIHQQVNK